MSKINILLLSLFFCFQQNSISQKNRDRNGISNQSKSFSLDTTRTEYFEKAYFRYENFVYKKNIKTVLLHEKSLELSTPLLFLGSDEQLKLSFDDFEADFKTYNYTLIHCDANWQPSDMSNQDYISGFAQDYITDYKYSFNSTQKYIHYNLLFPNDNIKMTKSGNYILKVYQDNDPENFIISRRFMVFESKVGITAQVKPATIVSDRYYKQEIDFVVDYSGYEIANPYSDIVVVIAQNDRWDNAISKLKPLFVRENQLIYDYDEDNVFSGDNEFRFFDTRSLKYQAENTKKILYDSLHYHVYLQDDVKRSFKRYSSISDINGKFLIKTQEWNDSEREADYAFIHFFLPYVEPSDEGVVYVLGSFTDWHCSEVNKMKYNYDAKGYECSIYLKQGFYNYEYGILKDGQNYPDGTFIEGMHYETENDYIVYVYHKALGSRYDQLIGIKRVNSQR